MKWLTFWAADKDMKLEMISSGAPIRGPYKALPFLFLPEPFIRCVRSRFGSCRCTKGLTKWKWNNGKKMRLINITSLTVICLALRTPLVWQLICSWWHYKNVFSFAALSVVNLVSFSRQSPLQGADELAASKEVSNAWAAVIARIISSAIWVS